MSEVRFTRLRAGVPVPAYAHPGDAGADLVAAEASEIAPGNRALVPTGIAIALPAGLAAFVQPRSGLALHHGLTIANSPGTIDSGYRGEIAVLLINHDTCNPVQIAVGERIAQLVVQRVEQVQFLETDELHETTRGTGGYGSTGGHASLSRASPGN